MASNPLPDGGPRKPGSVGKGTDVDIAILDEKGAPLPKGEKVSITMYWHEEDKCYLNI